MSFPFTSPFKKWITEKLDERDSNPQKLNSLSPFAIMSSAAVVLKEGNVTDLFNTQDYGKDAYYGCVISNNTNISKLYQTTNTIVGYDLNGKEIKVIGESNRRVSTPIIESIEIDTDGGNNTLKSAQVKVRVFTLKQLEMFELFFLRPSMNVVLEYGWNDDLINNRHIIESKLFAKKGWTQYKKDYVSYYINKTKADDYITTLKETGGQYDFMLGIVTNFNYSIEEGGTYLINIEVSAGNELQLWPALKSAKNSLVTLKKNNSVVNTYKGFIKKMAAELGIPQLETDVFRDESKWKDEFFNYGITNEKQKNTIVSKTPYISFKAIIEIVNNLLSIKNIEGGLAITYEYKGKDLIPVMSNPYIISTNPNILLPGSLPKIKFVKTDGENVIVLSKDDSDRQSCFINKKEFNLDNSKIYDFDNEQAIDPKILNIKSKINNKEFNVFSNTANLLNLFFSYERFLEIIEPAESMSQIVTPILEEINNSMLGLSKLELQKPQDSPNIGQLEIVDLKTNLPKTNKTNEQDIKETLFYKFKIGPKHSIVKNLTFNMEMSTLMQAQALYSTQLAIAKANNKSNTTASKEIDKYKSADLSYAKNADGYFSLNDLQVEIIKSQPIKKTEKSEKEIKEEETKIDELIQSKYTKFLINDELKNMVYQDSGLVQLYLLPKLNKNSLALTYLDISLEIDGMSGFSCGEYFNIEGIPEIYNRNGYFQILNVKQGIDSSGWKTTIEAGFLLKTE